MSATHDTPTGTASEQGRPTTLVAIGATAVLTVTTLVSYLVTGGAPGNGRGSAPGRFAQLPSASAQPPT